jgi:hypothetical protein
LVSRKPGGDEPSSRPEPPYWAIEQAIEELFDAQDRAAIVSRAWEISREASQLEDERHDEYDDPDQGGEA